MEKFKTGFVSIIGRPNVGKSTLLNKVLKTKVSIVTDKPQTTRDRISGVYNSDKGQIIFLDTPGYHKESNKMNSFMNNVIFLSAKNCDLILLTVPCDEFIGSNDKKMLEYIKKWNIPTILLITKIDKISTEEVDLKQKEWSGLYPDFIDVVRVSALNDINIDVLINTLYNNLPYSDIKYYPEDQITDKSDSFLIKEFIREEVLLQTEQEVPHASAIMIEKIVDQKDVLKVYVAIYVERPTQKAIIIGKNGTKIKSIGMAARKKIEEFLNRKVYLETYVKVKNDWTKSGSMLKRLGYDIDEY